MHLSYIMYRFYNIIIVLFQDPILSLRESVMEQFNYDMTAFVCTGGLLVKIK